MNDKITLAHGAGGKQTSELIGGLFKKYFDNPNLTADDAAVLTPPAGEWPCPPTDSSSLRPFSPAEISES